MEYRPLGRTGLQVSVIGLGCAMLGSSSTDYAVRVIRRALELGVNYIDTARVYRDAETKLGLALVGDRDRVLLSTKTTAQTRDQAWKDIETSLGELRTDHVENIHLHALRRGRDVEERMGPEGALQALVEAREQGITRHIGATSHHAEVLVEALDRYPFEVILVPMNYVEQQPLQTLIPLCNRRGVGITIMKPLATGLLPAPLALKWLMRQQIASAVPGATTLEEVEQNSRIGHETATFTAQEQAELERSRLYWDHRRCRLCAECLPCPAEISIPSTLGTDVMYDHYRTMGPEAFRAFQWSRQAAENEVPRRKASIKAIESCRDCKDCEARCPHDLPITDMLKAMLPGMYDMVRAFEELKAGV